MVKLSVNKLSDLGEFGLIKRFKRNSFVCNGVIKGIGDDTAVVHLSKNKYQLLTTDMLVENVHFTNKMSARSIGHKALAVNLSDIAAMGGTPKYALISIGVPASLSFRFLDQVYQGINQTAKKYGVSLVGGDTNRSGKIIINVTLIGEVKRQGLTTRSGAKVGDQIFVTGRLGHSYKSGWHLRFQPRICEAQYLVEHFKPTSMIDISDGFVCDLGHILRTNHVSAVINESRIPKRKGANLKSALYDGEDFELLFTLSLNNAKRLINDKVLKVYPVGEIVKGKPVVYLNEKNKSAILNGGYKHF